MATISTRLTSNGNLLVNGSFDEVTYNPTNPTIKNLFTYTQDLSNPIWLKTGSTVTANVAVAPDGTLTASKLVGNSGITSRKAVGQNITIEGNVYYTYSVYLKAAEFQSTYIWFDILGTTPNPYQGAGSAVNLTLGTVTGSQTTISSIGNGWYRCQTSAAANATTTTRFQVSLGDPNGAGTPAGDGTSGLYIWGEQLELGNVATIYQPIDAANTLVSGSLFKQTLDTVYTAQFDEVTGMTTSANLIFYVDPGETASYVGTGTRINDIQTTTVVGTTQNNPSFTSTAPGYFTYDGTSQYIDFGNVTLAELQDKTVTAWVYINTTLTSPDGIIDKDFDNGGTNYGGWGFWAGPITGGNGLWFWAQANKDLKDTTILTVNTWYHVAVVWNYTSKSATFYVNGVAKTTQTDATIVEKTSDSTSMKIGAIRTPAAGFFPGRIGGVQVYNRQLSASEILTNYNADAVRYGYTPTATVPVKRDTNDGYNYILGQYDEFTGAPVVDANLELWLDAGQTISYSGTGTAWNDISGNNNNFTLTSLTYNPLGWISYTANVLNYAQSNTVISLASTAITVECWVKLAGHSNWNDLVSNNWINSGWNLFVGSTLWYFAIAQSGSQYVASAAHGGTTEWTQVTGTYDGTNVRLYVNGVSVASPVTIAGATLDTGYFVRVGQQNDPNSYDISSVKVYNRALSADEVAQNFNALRRRYNI